MNSKNSKKRLMYLSGEDFYLFCYSIFIILDSLDCTNGVLFKDYRKLAFLISIINDEKLIYIITNSTGNDINPVDKEYLFNSYSNGLMRRSEMLKLLFTLEKKGFVTLEKAKENTVIDLSLDKQTIPKNFFDKKVFSKEYKQAQVLKKNVRGLRSLKLETMLEKIYTNNGVKTWAI